MKKSGQVEMLKTFSQMDPGLNLTYPTFCTYAVYTINETVDKGQAFSGTSSDPLNQTSLQ